MPGFLRKYPRLALILLVSLALSLWGTGFGLPNHEHAYPYNPDEWTTMQCLQNMDPSHFDFNPHYFETPTFHIYLWGATFAVAHLAGFVRINASERYYFDHPENLARMMWLGRLWSVLFGVAAVLSTYLLARRLGLRKGTSELAALLMAVYPSCVVHNHFMKVNPLITLLIVVSILAADHWIRRGGLRSAILTGALVGLALSTKYSAALLVPVLVAAALLRWFHLRKEGAGAGITAPGGAFRRALRETGVVAAAVVVAFVAGTPYSVLAPREFFDKAVMIYFKQVFTEKNAGGAPALPLLQALRRVLLVHVTASTPALLLAAVPGIFRLAARRWRPLTILVFTWFVLFFLTTIRAGHLATDSRFLPLYPFTSLFAALALSELIRKRRALGLAATGLVLFVMGFWTVALLARFTGPMPQQLASEWASRNLKGTEKICLASKAIYWNPDLPLREYLQEENKANYERRTRWTFVEGRISYARARAEEPDVVFLTAWLPRAPIHMEWLTDPAYEVVATFPGRTHLFGRRFPVLIDFYDVDIWVLKRRSAGS